MSPFFDIQELPRGHLLAYPIDVAVNLHDNFPIGTIHILRKLLWVGGFIKFSFSEKATNLLNRPHVFDVY